MAERIGIRELRNNLTATIERVRDGETIEVTNHGKPVATLGPPSRRSRFDELVAAGEITPASVPLQFPLRRLPNLSGMTTDQIIEEDRADR
jgi:prevent-host-death family protein